MRDCPYCHRPYPNACSGCGEPIQQPERGRPRKWCDRPGCQVLRRRHGDAQNAQKPEECGDPGPIRTMDLMAKMRREDGFAV